MMRSLLAACALLATPAAHALAASDLGALGRMSLEELSNLVVTSVSKTPESVATAPAAVYVITRQDLLRSGATTLPEALRLAPNLQVAQTTSYAYTVAPRGLAGNAAFQNFPNKLLILIDGRSVYSPLFSGVYWGSQDVMLEDVDRIEVISGPGATLWGANAFNGVVNVITRHAADTEGALVSALAGDRQRGLQGRIGGPLGEHASARAYVKGLQWDALDLGNGTDAQDDGRTLQAGFRADWLRDANALTLQGDVRREWLNQRGPVDLDVRGANVVGRWRHAFSETSELSVQAYVDHVDRGREVDGVPFELRTYDLQIQHSLTLGARHRIVWGAGERATRYAIENSPTLQFVPDRRRLWLSNVFAQDTIALADTLHLTLGLKMERDPYVGWTPQPDVRLAWTPAPAMLWWASASRAIRSPTPFDVDVLEVVGGRPFVVGNPGFRHERVDAFQLGYRGQPLPTLSLSATLFYNEYDRLRNIETTPVTLLPLYWGNGLTGDARGVDAWANWQVTNRWRISPGLRLFRKDLEFAPGAARLGGVAQAGLDPRRQATLATSFELRPNLSLDAFLRYQGPIDEASLGDYTELDVRLGWQVSPTLDVALVGRNLLDREHVESTVPGAALVAREAYVTARWNF